MKQWNILLHVAESEILNKHLSLKYVEHFCAHLVLFLFVCKFQTHSLEISKNIFLSYMGILYLFIFCILTGAWALVPSEESHSSPEPAPAAPPASLSGLP